MGEPSGRATLCGLTIICAVALLVRCMVALHPYSGAGISPMYGDYEAQRHWMELSIHLPVTEWYAEGKSNNLTYWGLDYPPLSGYQSWLFGTAIHALDPDAVALHTSQGYETQHSKFLMRLSVIASDLLVFFPAVLLCLRVFGGSKTLQERQWWLLMVLLQPAAVLIDHGHFQYNNISLGFAAGAAGAIAAGHDCWGSVLFCLSLNHKQMSMYYAPAFFAHLLGKCLQRPTALTKVGAIAKLGLVVVATFALCWAPFLSSPSSALQVLQRLIPVKRGLYEDYVANFWCVSSPVFKWRRVYSQQALVKLCAGASLAAALPSMLYQMRAPSAKGLLLGMANSSLAFFLFSYQVHEKSILLPLLPVSLLAFEESVVAARLPVWATISMYPLLKKDGLSIAYLASLILWFAVAPGIVAKSNNTHAAGGSSNNISTDDVGVEGGIQSSTQGKLLGQRCLHYVSILSILPATCIHAAQFAVEPPARYLHLYDAAFVTLAFVHIAATFVYLNVRQHEVTRTALANLGDEAA
ncbi:hypothetical protein ABBQ38_003815 [Trebouxia sp. C0009 RCD-2024]